MLHPGGESFSLKLQGVIEKKVPFTVSASTSPLNSQVRLETDCMNSDFTVQSELMMHLQSLQTIYRPVSDLGHGLNWLKSEFKRSVLCSLNVFFCVCNFFLFCFACTLAG